MGGFEYQWEELANSAMTIEAAKEAYEMAGGRPEDTEVCELHDASTYSELSHYEELEFCEYGEGGLCIDEGHSENGGITTVNPSGGLLSKGPPISATGVAQIAEVTWQLRGESGQRQQHGAKLGMAHTAGGEVTGLESGSVAIHILKR